MTNQQLKPNEKHLEFIQAIISRMSHNCFQAKAWCITIITAILVFYISQQPKNRNCIIIWITCIVVSLFWVFDCYYYYLERLYRKLYKSVVGIEKDINIKEYDLEIPKTFKTWKSRGKSFLSFSTSGFYLAIIILLMILAKEL